MTYIRVWSVRCIVNPVREVRDEVSSNTECHRGYQEHHQVVNDQVGEVTFLAPTALGW